MSRSIVTKPGGDRGSAPPPLLLIGNFLTASLGVRHVSEDLAEHLGRRGWSLVTASSSPGRLGRVWEMLATAWRRRHDYAIAHIEVYSGLAFIWAELVAILLRLMRKPYLLTLHGGNLPEFASRWPRRVRHLFRHAAAITTPSRYLLEKMSLYAEGLILIPNALNVSRYRYRHREKPAPRLIWLRAFEGVYNPALAPRVVALIKPDYPSVSLVMIGPDKLDGSLDLTRQTCEQLGLGECVEFPGKVPKSSIPDWMDRADIFLNTTGVDNVPVSVMEAMSAGLCVVSTAVGGIPYLLDHEENALLTPPNDPEAMAEAVRRLLRDSTLASRLSQQARAKAEQWDWELVIQQWERLLTSVANGKQLVG